MSERMLRFACMGLLACLLQARAAAQEIKVTAGFIEDSVAIGAPINFYLTARYPESVMALFPDSSFSFAPFEFGDKQFFPTKTTNGISFDSAVYKLSTFEIETTQYLSLPVYVTTARDCTAFESLRDSVFLIEQIKIPATDTVSLKSLSLKSNTLYERVFTQFNTFILLIIVSVVVVAAILGWIFFGKRIIRHFKAKRLEKKYRQFVQTFSKQSEDIAQAFSREKTEAALSTWKKYLEVLERKPYTKLTTREVVKMDADTVLGNSLAKIDNAIYGNQAFVDEAFDALKAIAEQRFTKKINQIRHG